MVDPECHAEIDGRRPLASLWLWSETAASPWRACLKGAAFSNLDYTTRERAMTYTLRRALAQ